MRQYIGIRSEFYRDYGVDTAYTAEMYEFFQKMDRDHGYENRSLYYSEFDRLIQAEPQQKELYLSYRKFVDECYLHANAWRSANEIYSLNDDKQMRLDESKIAQAKYEVTAAHLDPYGIARDAFDEIRRKTEATSKAIDWNDAVHYIAECERRREVLHSETDFDELYGDICVKIKGTYCESIRCMDDQTENSWQGEHMK